MPYSIHSVLVLRMGHIEAQRDQDYDIYDIFFIVCTSGHEHPRFSALGNLFDPFLWWYNALQERRQEPVRRWFHSKKNEYIMVASPCCLVEHVLLYCKFWKSVEALTILASFQNKIRFTPVSLHKTRQYRFCRWIARAENSDPRLCWFQGPVLIPV